MRLETARLPFVTQNRQIRRRMAFWGPGSFNLSSLLYLESASPLSQELTTRLIERTGGFKRTGELINEDQIILSGEESKGLSVKGHDPKKDGINASRLPAETITSRKSIGSTTRQ